VNNADCLLLCFATILVLGLQVHVNYNMGRKCGSKSASLAIAKQLHDQSHGTWHIGHTFSMAVPLPSTSSRLCLPARHLLRLYGKSCSTHFCRNSQMPRKLSAKNMSTTAVPHHHALAQDTERARMLLEKAYMEPVQWSPLSFHEDYPLPLFLVSLSEKPPTEEKPPLSAEKSSDYYANVGDVIRALREDIPLLFQKDLNCKQPMSSVQC
jgi:hypothetical protein